MDTFLSVLLIMGVIGLALFGLFGVVLPDIAPNLPLPSFDI